ncbi:MAG TPA: rhamnogalacturonan acetylesterase [Edaphobacter sp.]|nr:rhamnogalacturonan acetylesterase [Edaphobacter sp.]
MPPFAYLPPYRALFRVLSACPALLMAISCFRVSAQVPQTFSCSHAKQTTHLSAASIYSDKVSDSQPAFGFDLATVPTRFNGNSCSAAKPFFFSIALRDGNYRVTLQMGGPEESVNTVRAESRRLMVYQERVAAGAIESIVFDVNVRTPTITNATPANNGEPLTVHLKPREVGAPDWDSKLTLEFNGSNPSVRSIEIRPVTQRPTVYLAGDSTVVDQDKEPWAAWGQMLPNFFGPDIAIANEAESGETIKSFESERRFAKIFSTLRAGDFLLIQFAHNDQKPGNGFVPIPEYKNLMRKYVAAARTAGATPILVTSMNRRTFAPDGHITQTLGEYPQATRDVAVEQNVALLDLNTMSKTLYEALGEEGALHAFVHYAANTFPDQTEELKDDTHFNSYGALELTKCVVQSIRDQQLPLARFLKPNLPVFDPAHPGDFTEFHLPPSPMVSTTTPYGH